MLREHGRIQSAAVSLCISPLAATATGKAALGGLHYLLPKSPAAGRNPYEQVSLNRDESNALIVYTACMGYFFNAGLPVFMARTIP